MKFRKKVINFYCNSKTKMVLGDDKSLTMSITIPNIIKMYKLVENDKFIINVVECSDNDYKKFRDAGIIYGRIPKNIKFEKNIKKQPKIGDVVYIAIKPYKGKAVKGVVKKVLTRKKIHPRGHKVMLETGEIGRVI